MTYGEHFADIAERASEMSDDETLKKIGKFIRNNRQKIALKIHEIFSKGKDVPDDKATKEEDVERTWT